MKQSDFEEMIRFMKRENQLMGWNALDVTVRGLLKTAGSAAAKECAGAVLACMLEGDQITKGSAEAPDEDLEVRYYCDNLSESRRRMF